MGKNKANISPVKRGMNRNTAPYQLEGVEYLFALNTNIQDEDTTVINITNEESNILATKFEEGFKVIGKRNDILTNGTYFFLVNDETKESQFGVIKNNQVEKPDILNDLEGKLEETEQEPYEQFEVLIDKGLNLDINYPVKQIIIKNEQCGTVIAFNDFFNSPKLFVLDKLEEYLISGKEVDPEKISIFKKSLLPRINVKPIVTGGRLRRGTYEFLIAYTDSLGEEVTEYTSITNPIPIFDPNDRIMESSEIADRTNFAIKLDIENIDQSKEYYKIVVIQSTSIDGAVRFFEEGIHPVSNSTIIYDTEENKKETTLSNINTTFPYVKKFKGITESEGRLIGYGITAEKEVNLQPVVNLMGSALKWQTSLAKESLYESGDDVSESKGYMRNETYPWSIRLVFNSGYKTALFPFINRPSDTFIHPSGQQFDEIEVAPDNKDRKSINSNNPAFSTSERTKVWQYYNTASKEGNRDVDIDYTIIQEPLTKTSFIEEVGTIPQPTNFIKIEIGDEEFTNFKDFIENNFSAWEDVNHPNHFLYTALLPETYPEHKIPKFKDCDTPVRLEERDKILVKDVIGENSNLVPKETNDYLRIALNGTNTIYKYTTNDDGDLKGVRRDPSRKTETASVLFSMSGEYAFEKTQNFTNTSCKYALPLQNISISRDNITSLVSNMGYFNDIVARDTQDEILTDYESREFTGTTVDGVSGKYYDHVHANALWFRGEFEEGEDVKVLEITKAIEITGRERYANRHSLRITIFEGCNSFEYIKAVKVDPEEGLLIEISKEDLGITSNEFTVAVDTLVMSTNGLYAASSFQGLYGIHMRSQEYSILNVTFQEIILDKQEVYRADCKFKIPNVKDYEIVPFEYGKFAYTESLEVYPDNKELYDSSNLKIDLDKIPESFKEDFKKYYIKTNPDGTYQLNDKANFIGKPIRHFKFPDNDVSSFMSGTQQAAFSESLIFPIGAYIDDDVVSAFLDIAVDNDLLTQEQRDSVVAYEIFRGDRRLEKSIEAKGLLYDNYQVKEDNEQVYFPNFPYNSLGTNELLYENEDRNDFIKHPFDSNENTSFTFHSPENSFRKLSDPTELQVEGYQFGNSKGYFTNVEGHPEWTILGKKAYKLANTLAITETLAEVAIQIAQAMIDSAETWRVDGGVVFSANPVGIGLGLGGIAIITGFNILSSVVFSVARYRQEWITTFKNLGQPENFAAYYTSVGHYNSLRSLPYIGNSLRGINTIKSLNSGRFSFRHNDTGERIVMNNQDRESTTYLYLGKDFSIEYPTDYKEYDNYETNTSYSSRTFASSENACKKGQSPEVLSNISSPYVSLKNYIPSQYGSIDSINWLPTSYISYLDGNQDTIFGGDTFITRMALKRKTPMFLRDSMKLAPLTPFNYGFYSNIGDVRFYCNYEIPEEINLENSIFPDNKSTFNFDCTTGEYDFYIKPPTKFYLYYYGIPSFLVESEINVNFRYGKKDYRDNFYPNTSDIVDWTQEDNVSIKEPNTFYYNPTYSKPVTTVTYRTLPATYSKEEYDCKYDSPNGAMWSDKDVSEKDSSEPWLTFRPYNFHNFPTSYGSLTSLKGIENKRILGKFTNQTAIFNAVDVAVDGIKSDQGDGALFSRTPITFTETDLGYLGSKTADTVSCEYGHYFPDVERGQIFKIEPSGQGMEEISKYSNGKLNGMDKWFKKHLPFKIHNTLINNYEDIDVDNAFNGIGITMGYDTKYKRIFFTKKDYIPLKEMNYENRNFFAAKDEIELITDYESDGYTYLGKEGYYYKFNKQSVTIPEGAKIFVTVNTNDYTVSEGQELKGDMADWKADIGYTGEIVFIPIKSNRWLKSTSEIIEDDVNDLDTTTQWQLLSNYNGQSIDKEGIVIHFINSSAYSSDEPNNEFLNDYKRFKTNFNTTDYLRNVIITKGSAGLTIHLNKVLNALEEYKDYPIRGTSPQQFIEPLNIYGYDYTEDPTLDTQKSLNEILGDSFDKGTILVKGDIIKVTDTDYFKDVSWTIAYQAETASWLSYYSFEPNYYISHNTYFQTGVNTLEGKEGVWSHNMSNKSYGVFYGEKEPWIIEYPIKNEFVTKRLQSINLHTEARKYINDYDFAYDRYETFDSAIIYNSSENSGKLNLIPQKTLSQITKYPIKRANSQDILITNQDYKWNFNNIYNRALNQDGTDTMWISDENQIHKNINNDLVRFGGKKILSYLRGNYFIVRLEHNKSSEHQLFLKWSTNKEEIY